LLKFYIQKEKGIKCMYILYLNEKEEIRINLLSSVFAVIFHFNGTLNFENHFWSLGQCLCLIKQASFLESFKRVNILQFCNKSHLMLLRNHNALNGTHDESYCSLHALNTRSYHNLS
jgi:hypothetical protein